jgi:hypothetical protein
MLYPLDLVAVEERFGSWMNQYGYANQITQAKLVELGTVRDGAIELAGRRFATLVATFEPFPSEALLAMMKDLAESGGRAVWSGPPPVLTADGRDALTPWMELFGVAYEPGQDEGLLAPGRIVAFEGTLADVAPQTILTDFLVDRIYAVAPNEGTETVARAKDFIIGTFRALASGGSATFLGYRPRDDQSQSLGYDVRNWFEVLSATGAYPGDDNTERLSRVGDLLACRFPNGTISVCNHLRELAEGWPGGFARDAEEDAKYIEEHPLDPTDLALEGVKLDGHTIDYHGDYILAVRPDDAGNIIAFAGHWADRITIDGRETIFADKPMQTICWAPVAEARRVDDGAIMQIKANGEGTARIPAPGLPESVKLFAEGPTPGSRGEEISFTREGDTLVIPGPQKTGMRWIYVVPD